MEKARFLRTDAETGLGEGETFKEHDETVTDEDVPIGEHVYAFATASLIRDYVHVWLGFNSLPVRLARMAVSALMALGCLWMQIFLLRAVYSLLCASAVHKIRNDYSKYELTVYGKHHVRTNEHGFYRGLGEEFLDVTRFEKMSDDEKHHICQIPLAHPEYTAAILLVWTLTCLADLRKTLSHIQGLMFLTPTVKTLEEVLEKKDEGTVTVAGLTLSMKGLLSVFCLIPRTVSVSLLAYLGCRWLMATNSLNDILLNALALEFIMTLQYLMYETLVSKRGRHLTENTLVKAPRAGDLTFASAVGSSLWLLVAVIWVYVYIYYLQAVLPDYRWDVKPACKIWKGAVHL